jgi:hypothetical protein
MRVGTVGGGKPRAPPFAPPPPDWMVSRLEEIADLVA